MAEDFAFLSARSAGVGLVGVAGVERNTAGARAVQIAQNKTVLIAVYEDGSVWLAPNKQIVQEMTPLEAAEPGTSVYCMDNVFLVVLGNSSLKKVEFRGKKFVLDDFLADELKDTEIVKIAAGEGGLVIVTSSSAFYHVRDLYKGQTVKRYELGSENFTIFQIDRVDVNAVPIFYLKNGSVFVFGMKDTKFFCGVDDPAAEKFLELSVLNVTRFCPYARLDESGSTVSTYLKDGRVFYCSKDQKSGELDYEYGKSSYFDYYESKSSKLAFLSNSSHTVIAYNGNQIVANATHPYQLKLDSWLVASRTLDIGGTSVDA